MGKRKGVSAEEKRERIVAIYHDTKEPYNLKEIEQLGGKKGVVTQTIKDVNQGLIDDNLVDCEKIGSGNFFWSFPSKFSQTLQTKLKKQQDVIALEQKKLNELKEQLTLLQSTHAASDERTAKLAKLAQVKTQVAALKQDIEVRKANDPKVLGQLETSIEYNHTTIEQKLKISKEAAERWTDNIFTLQSWIAQRQGCAPKECHQFLGIDENFDYVQDLK